MSRHAERERIESIGDELEKWTRCLAARLCAAEHLTLTDWARTRRQIARITCLVHGAYLTADSRAADAADAAAAADADAAATADAVAAFVAAAVAAAAADDADGAS